MYNMNEIVLFHSALGLRPGVHTFADGLRAAGHRVHTPDLFDGATFDELEAGVAHRDLLGIAEIAARAQATVADLPASLVYAGFSLGAGPAQLLAQTRGGSRGAILMHGALPSTAFGCPWPRGVPLAIHAMHDDEWVDMTVAQALADEAGGTLDLYPGSGHLFADPDLPDFDADAANLMLGRTLAFLERLG